MQFLGLIKNLKKEVKGITDDSRKVKKGYLFVAMKGLTVDGHEFIPQAIKNGAKIVVGERDLNLESVSYIKVPDSRKAFGLLASSWYDSPSKKLKVVGVTGTDGKTTTSNLVYSILKMSGRKVGLVSTINAKIGNKEYDTGFHVTNPEPLLLQKLLSQMVEKGCEYAVLEVTSHGLDQERVAGVKFDIGVLTNITHEHLDYHKTFEAYREAKAKLFKDVRFAVLNKDDESFEYLTKRTKGQVVSYSIEKEAEFRAEGIRESEKGTQFTLVNKKKEYLVKTKLLGKYNVYNILAAVATALVSKVGMEDIQKAIESFEPLIGRLEEIKNNKGIKIYVDFAHTPNALREVLMLLSARKKGRLIPVFGCAGERDRQKRKMMGEISGRLADISVFTAEDPRSEDVNKIIDEMAEGARKSGAKEGMGEKYFVRVSERGEAIARAIQKLAKRGDIVVVCGKGHEKSMAYNGTEYPWSDQEAVEMALRGEVKVIKRNGKV